MQTAAVLKLWVWLQRAGNSVEVLLTRYAKCLYDRQSTNNQRIEHLLSANDQPPEQGQYRPGWNPGDV